MLCDSLGAPVSDWASVSVSDRGELTDPSLPDAPDRRTVLGGRPILAGMWGRHIAISGVVGAGKTTLVRGLAREFGCLDLEERFEENPYLERFYVRPPAWAFKSYV